MNSGTVARALDGRRLVVMGGTSGIGLSAAKAFLAAGARVAAVGVDEEGAAAARRELGEGALVLCGDAREAGTAESAVAEAVRAFGGLDGLYHVAGGSGRPWGDGPLHEITDEGWRRTMDLNLTSVIFSNRAAVRQFRAQGTGGAVLNMSSVLAFAPSPDHFSTHAYAAAKAAIAGLTRSCAARYAKDDIRFNAIAPGLVETPMSRRAAGDPRIMAFIASKQPLDGGRIGRPADLDAAAVFFLSDGARCVTGQVLAVDGGWSVSEGRMAATEEGE